MLLDPETLDLTPSVDLLLARVENDPRFTAELPAAQVEILTAPSSRVADVMTELSAARRDLHQAADGVVALAVAGTHPFASELGVLNTAPRYVGLRERYASVANRQLVAGLQIHVAVGGADRSLAVYNALRGLLPEIMALAANAPFYGGVDTGLATMRPLIAGQLPRQGLPPFLESWEHFAAELAWGARAGTLSDVTQWWWELRPHPRHGTLELRVPDAQTSLTAVAGIAAFVQALMRVADRSPRRRRRVREPAPVAHRREPLVSNPPRPGRFARRPGQRPAAADPGAALGIDRVRRTPCGTAGQRKAARSCPRAADRRRRGHPAGNCSRARSPGAGGMDASTIS